jgi:hypothetical protein
VLNRYQPTLCHRRRQGQQQPANRAAGDRVRQFRKLADRLGPIVEVVSDALFGFLPGIQEWVVDAYRNTYAPNAGDYALEALPRSHPGTTRTSKQTVQRLLNPLPRYLRPQQRRAMVQRMCVHHQPMWHAGVHPHACVREPLSTPPERIGTVLRPSNAYAILPRTQRLSVHRVACGCPSRPPAGSRTPEMGAVRFTTPVFTRPTADRRPLRRVLPSHDEPDWSEHTPRPVWHDPRPTQPSEWAAKEYAQSAELEGDFHKWKAESNRCVPAVVSGLTDGKLDP